MAALPKRKKPKPACFPIVCYIADVIKIVYVKKRSDKLEMTSLDLTETENFVPVL